MAMRNIDSLDKKFHALGDGSRREILALISKKQRCTAGELVEQFSSSQPTISKHLKVLESAGLIVRHIEGRHHNFTLGSDGLKEADAWIKRHIVFWENSLDRLGQFLDANKDS